MTKHFGRLVVSILLGVVLVHYLEQVLMPSVVSLRSAVLDIPDYQSVFEDCDALNAGDDWVHPTALSLAVYGPAQDVLSAQYGQHSPEVLPDYRDRRSDIGDLLCVADFLRSRYVTESLDGLPVRPVDYQIAKPDYGLPSGWVSGLAQGFVGQVFLAAHIHSGDPAYLEAARDTGNLLRVPVDSGGTAVAVASGEVWFEEYAFPGHEPPLVLNGHLLALDFLHWMRLADPTGEWGALFDSGVDAAASTIDRYVAPFWSYYDAKGNFANRKYHQFHIRQLTRYERYDESGALSAAAEKMEWQLMVPAGVFVRLFTQPTNALLLMVAGMSAGIFFIISGIAGFRRTST